MGVLEQFVELFTDLIQQFRVDLMIQEAIDLQDVSRKDLSVRSKSSLDPDPSITTEIFFGSSGTAKNVS